MSASSRARRPRHRVLFGVATAVAGVAIVLVIVLAPWRRWIGGRASPKPSSVYQTRYPDIPRIDVHVHVAPQLADRAVAMFAKEHVRVALNASGGHPGPQLETSAAIARRTHGALRPYCNLAFSRVEDPDFDEYVNRTLDQCVAQGAVGLGEIFKTLGLGIQLSDGSLLRVDDPRLDVVFDGAARRGLPILIHSGDPQAFFRPPTPDNERYAELRAHPGWSFYGKRPNGRPWPSWRQVFDEFRARVARHPQATFIGAHFGNAPEQPELVAAMLDEYPHYMIDTAARIPEIGRHDPERMRKFFMKYQDRILFGSDVQMSPGWLALGSAGSRSDPPSRVPVFYGATWRYFETRDRAFENPTPIQGSWTIDGIGLPRSVLEKVYYRNAARVFRIGLR